MPHLLGVVVGHLPVQWCCGPLLLSGTLRELFYCRFYLWSASESLSVELQPSSWFFVPVFYKGAVLLWLLQWLGPCYFWVCRIWCWKEIETFLPNSEACTAHSHSHRFLSVSWYFGPSVYCLYVFIGFLQVLTSLDCPVEALPVRVLFDMGAPDSCCGFCVLSESAKQSSELDLSWSSLSLLDSLEDSSSSS